MRRVLVGVGVSMSARCRLGACGVYGAPRRKCSGRSGLRRAGQDSAAGLKMYTEKVVPIFQANCYRCHGGMNHRGGFT